MQHAQHRSHYITASLVTPTVTEREAPDRQRRVTEETGSGGDPHLHAERKADEISREMTEDTGAEGDMQVHADRKVEQMGEEMFEDV